MNLCFAVLISNCGKIPTKFVKVVKLLPAQASSPGDSPRALLSIFCYTKMDMYLDPTIPGKKKITKQRESGLEFLIFFKDYLYIYINKKCKEQTFMFKLYSKIKYIFPLTAGDNWQGKSLRESSTSSSPQWTYI